MTTKPWNVLALAPLDEGIVRGLFAPLGEAVRVSFPSSRDRAGVHAAIADADVVVSDFSGALPLDAETVRAASRLAFVQLPQVGSDNVDLDALTDAGVPVANTAGVNTRAVAEWAVGAAFALCRGLVWADRAVRSGGWPQMEALVRGGRELHTQRVGIVGYGAIGAEAARLFSALGCPVSYWTRRRRPEAPATYRELDDLLAHSDILVIALPLTDETRNLLDDAKLALLPPRALLINVARAGIVPEDSVVAALDSGHLAAAALDVFEIEPPELDNPLRTHENVLLSPHAAWATSQAQVNSAIVIQDNVKAAVEGRPVRNVINGLPPKIDRR
ncbi:2-hydroxyacid dehydrogenase [Actinomadura rupiterrae]|uniref:2-hydroxyacid dehydrogenase n=1 Tax=Actinomadura rupiterrae TaxID=559627 RepID=UPI0020A326DB|nr:NAD(P)-dependent oxidoreductase [Actinomadura rupiterrae]MCP2336937.1 D-3-phosphoglycerate dehydrogenase [Actinomadura rupiterrae]